MIFDLSCDSNKSACLVVTNRVVRENIKRLFNLLCVNNNNWPRLRIVSVRNNKLFCADFRMKFFKYFLHNRKKRNFLKRKDALPDTKLRNAQKFVDKFCHTLDSRIGFSKVISCYLLERLWRFCKKEFNIALHNGKWCPKVMLCCKNELIFRSIKRFKILPRFLFNFIRFPNFDSLFFNFFLKISIKILECKIRLVEL